MFFMDVQKNNLKKVVYAHCNASFMCRSQEKKAFYKKIDPFIINEICRSGCSNF